LQEGQHKATATLSDVKVQEGIQYGYHDAHGNNTAGNDWRIS